MKTCKISCRKVKISISPRGGNFQFSAWGERHVYLKKVHLGLKFLPGVNFTSPTCNMPLRFGVEKCLDFLTEVRLILRYIGLRLPLKGLNNPTWLGLILLWIWVRLKKWINQEEMPLDWNFENFLENILELSVQQFEIESHL